MGDIEHDKKIGKEGEEAFLNILKSHPLTKSVEDVRDNRVYWARGIDFLWYTVDDERISIDVKTEQKHTGNLFLETISKVHSGVPGWFLTSQADWIAYGFLDTKKWYLFDLPVVREKLGDCHSLKKITAETTQQGVRKWETEGALWSLSDARNEGLISNTVDGAVGRERETGRPIENAVFHLKMRRLGLGTIVSSSTDYLVCFFEGETEPRKFRAGVIDDGMIILAHTSSPVTREKLRHLVLPVLDPDIPF